MGEQAFCIHGHFYQPPREDPFTNEIPQEPGAAPYKNWNERIHEQCYRPNARLENFERISFNIGPTLGRWMVDFDPGTLARIVEQDRRNLIAHGVGNAMAQPYNHTILPLALRHDKETQVRWGIADFEYYFGHKPSGMWLPETAVDIETLEVLSECEIEYTILAPWQANAKKIDIHHPYLVSLPGKRQIAVFFYHRELSGRVSFDPTITENADKFVPQILLPQYEPPAKGGVNPKNQLIVIASDGELYGHHQPFRDLFLNRLMTNSLKEQKINWTYLALWLKQYPPTEKVAIKENTSWSCHHGVKRWSTTCDCTPHGDWKEPLRSAMNYLAAAIDAEYLRVVEPYLKNNPWELRHEYIRVINRQMTLQKLLESLTESVFPDDEVKKIGLLLRAQYERQRMFTSCGWFFDDFDRIEPRNNLVYAAQAVRLTYLATGVDLEMEAMTHLQDVKSWRSGLWGSTLFRHHLNRARELVQS